jgi:hypothetical protein
MACLEPFVCIAFFPKESTYFAATFHACMQQVCCVTQSSIVKYHSLYSLTPRGVMVKPIPPRVAALFLCTDGFFVYSSYRSSNSKLMSH